MDAQDATRSDFTPRKYVRPSLVLSLLGVTVTVLWAGFSHEGAGLFLALTGASVLLLLTFWRRTARRYRVPALLVVVGLVLIGTAFVFSHTISLAAGGSRQPLWEQISLQWRDGFGAPGGLRFRETVPALAFETERYVRYVPLPPILSGYVPLTVGLHRLTERALGGSGGD
jgi:uncharacterized membrane protein (UPF0136 family)